MALLFLSADNKEPALFLDKSQKRPDVQSGCFLFIRLFLKRKGVSLLLKRILHTAMPAVV